MRNVVGWIFVTVGVLLTLFLLVVLIWQVLTTPTMEVPALLWAVITVLAFITVSRWASTFWSRRRVVVYRHRFFPGELLVRHDETQTMESLETIGWVRRGR